MWGFYRELGVPLVKVVKVFKVGTLGPDFEAGSEHGRVADWAKGNDGTDKRDKDTDKSDSGGWFASVDWVSPWSKYPKYSK
jgi:hypothetical protein